VADDCAMAGQTDRIRIKLNKDYEVRYWMQRETGVMVKEVARKLGKDS